MVNSNKKMVSEQQIVILKADIAGVEIAKTYLSSFKLEEEQQKDLDLKIKKLELGTPLDYLLSKINIEDLELTVDEGVFIPRHETLEWVDYVITKFNTLFLEVEYIYDLCSGTGLVGLKIAKTFSTKDIISVEYSELAVNNIKKNIELNNIKNLEVVHSKFQDVEFKQNSIVLINPPYVPESDIERVRINNIEHEPKDAIFSVNHGLQHFYDLVDLVVNSRHKPRLIAIELDPRNIEIAKEFCNAEMPGYETEIFVDSAGLGRCLVLGLTKGKLE